MGIVWYDIFNVYELYDSKEIKRSLVHDFCILFTKVRNLEIVCYMFHTLYLCYTYMTLKKVKKLKEVWYVNFICSLFIKYMPFRQ